MPSQHPPILMRAAVAASALLAITLTACGGSGNASAPSTPPASPSVTAPLTPVAEAALLQVLAGDDGGPGVIDGDGARARLAGAEVGAFDRAGNLYLSDLTSFNNGRYSVATSYGEQRGRIRKVTPGGQVSTVVDTAGSTVDGAAGVAKLRGPGSMVATADGSLYFVDLGGEIRKRDQAGSITTLVAAGTQELPLLRADASGKLYAIQPDSIGLLSPAGALTLVAGAAGGGGTALDGQGANARFLSLRDAAADAGGNLYLIDGASIRKMTPAGAVTTLAGRADDSEVPAVDGSGAAARFTRPASIAVAADGRILVVDRNSASGALLRTVTPAGAVSSVPLAHPGVLLASPLGPVLIGNDFALETLASDGSTTPFVGKNRSVASVDGNGTAARFLAPAQLTADQAGNLYVLDMSSPLEVGPFDPAPNGFSVRKLTPAGVVTTLASASDVGNARGIVVARDGAIYISTHRPDSAVHGLPWTGGAIFKLAPGGGIVLLAGNTKEGGQVDASGAAARFDAPQLKGMSADGYLYVNDGAAVRKVSTDGVVTTVGALPADLAASAITDAAGNVYVTGYDNGEHQHVVFRTTPAGVKSVVAGVAGPGQYGTLVALDGALPGHLLHPIGLVQTGPYSFALISYGAIVKLVVPH